MPVPTVRSHRDGDVTVLTLDYPPVNALGRPLREDLAAALAAAAADMDCRAVVLAGAGRCFCAGGDIKEFGQPQTPPRTVDILSVLETFPKPVVAVIHGKTLGGGLELALTCHARVADPTAEVGLPEVTLGLIPGAGGTQRLPRAVGLTRALDLIANARQLSAAQALDAGLIQAIDTKPLAAAITLGRSLADEGAAQIPPVRRLDETERAAFEEDAARLLAKRGRLDCLTGLVESLRNTMDLDFPDALVREQEIFQTLRAGDQSKALRHLFLAQRAAATVAGATPSDGPEIASAGVIGAGTMGGGIAMAFADAGIPVTLVDSAPESLERGLARIRDTYAVSVKRGRLSTGAMEERLSRITAAPDMAALSDVDIAVEAVFEDMDLKQALFRRLDGILRPGALLATNTSSLDIDALARVTNRPEWVLGTHFFSPANVMRLLEVVRGAATAPAVLAAAVRLAGRLGKVAVVVGNGPGFVGNRILWRRHMGAERLLALGASPAEVDAALVDFGYPMGPFAMSDLAGLDVARLVRKAQGFTLPIADRICDRGWLGQKTGRGYFRYETGSRLPLPDPEVEDLIAGYRREQGLAARPLSASEILDHLLLPMVNEAARVLEEGIALRSADIDVVHVHGYGFPSWRGGLAFYADARGLDTVAARLRDMARDTGDASLNPAPLLARLAAEGRGFGAWSTNQQERARASKEITA